MVNDIRPYLALAGVVFGAWIWSGTGLEAAVMAGVGWAFVAFMSALMVELMAEDRRHDRGFSHHFMTPISVLGMAVGVLGRTVPQLLNAVYAVPEGWRGVRMPYHGVFDADWWNAPWVVPTALGVSLALIVFDLFVRGPFRVLLIRGVDLLVHPFIRRW